MEARKQVKPRVLLAGMHVFENNFTRQLQGLGCEVIWYDGRPGKSFPHFCDFAVITTVQCSHHGKWAVQEAYKKLGKPCFTIAHSFSPIKGQVAQLVTEWNMKHPGTTMSQAFQVAEKKEEPVKLVKSEPAPVAAVKKAVPVYDANRIERVIRECHAADMSAQETADMLKAEGLCNSWGSDYTAPNIYNWKNRLKLTKQNAGSPTARPVASKAVAVGSAPTEPAKRSQSNEAQMFDRILKLDMSPERKVELLTRVNSGALAAADALWLLAVIDEVRNGK